MKSFQSSLLIAGVRASATGITIGMADKASISLPDPLSARKLGLSRSTTVKIHNPEGRRIAGTLDFPQAIGAVENLPEAHLPVAIVAHCFTCNRHSLAASQISKSLAKMGYLSLRIDMEGLGDSDGRMEDSTLSRQIDDVVCAGEWLDAQSATTHPTSSDGTSPKLLIGHSLGGAAVLRAAPRIKNARAVATIGTPFDPAHATATMPKLEQRFREEPSLDAVPIPGRGVNLGRAMVEELKTYTPEEGATAPGRNGIASLFLHTPLDDLVPYEHAEQLYAAALQPKSLISIPEADHLLSKREMGQRVAELISLWAQPYMHVD